MDNKQTRLINANELSEANQQLWIKAFQDNDGIISNDEKQAILRRGSITLWYKHEDFALKSLFIDNKINLTKQHFFTCGMLDAFLISKYNEPILDYGINHFSYALLSDNMPLINKYANLTHSYYSKSINNGTGTPTYVMQCLIKEDWAEYERAMEIMRTKTLKKYPKTMFLDIAVFEGIAEKNKLKVEQALAEFVTPKMHKMRNKLHTLLNEFISHPALGYAKLAWLKGLEVHVDSPLVPKELLPIKPLERYINEYAFLDEVQLPKQQMP